MSLCVGMILCICSWKHPPSSPQGMLKSPDLVKKWEDFRYSTSTVCSVMFASLHLVFSLVQLEHSSQLTIKDSQLTAKDALLIAKDAEISRLGEEMERLQVLKLYSMYPDITRKCISPWKGV